MICFTMPHSFFVGRLVMRLFLFTVMCGFLFVTQVLAAQIVQGQRLGLSERRVHFVARVGDNWLFRGNKPTEGEDQGTLYYDYKDLKVFLQDRAKEEGYADFPETFKLVDVSLLSATDPGNWKELRVESGFFADHPELGLFDPKPITGGALTSPNKYSAKERAFLIKHRIPTVFSVDHLTKKLEDVNKMLHTTYTVPHVFFVHCEVGCDRTGEFVGAYRMRYQNMDLLTAWKKDTEECQRPAAKYTRNGLQWYCYALGHGEEECGQPLPALDVAPGYLPFSEIASN
jgi:hypothetical protein